MERTNLKRELRLVNRILTLTGVFPPKEGSPFKRFYHVYAIIIQIIIGVVVYVPFFIKTWVLYDDPSQVIFNGQINIHYLVSFLKGQQFLRRTEIVQKLLHMSTKGIFQAKSEEEEQVLLARFKHWYVMYAALMGSVLVTVAWLLSASIATTTGDLPLSSWFPFDIEHSPYYRVWFAGQGWALYFNGFGNCTVDSFLGAMMLYIACQCKMLKLSLRRRFQTNRPDSPEERLANLVEAITHHQQILVFYKTTEKLFVSTTLLQLLSNIFSITACMYRLHEVSPSSPEFSQAFIYSGIVFGQLFMYCFLGQLLISEAVTLPEALIDAVPWYNEPMAFKKLFLIFLHQSQYPIEMKAGGVVTLSYITFATIMRTSYSYLTILIQVAD